MLLALIDLNAPTTWGVPLSTLIIIALLFHIAKNTSKETPKQWTSADSNRLLKRLNARNPPGQYLKRSIFSVISGVAGMFFMLAELVPPNSDPEIAGWATAVFCSGGVLLLIMAVTTWFVPDRWLDN